jgi:hypothetical protein
MLWNRRDVLVAKTAAMLEAISPVRPGNASEIMKWYMCTKWDNQAEVKSKVKR